MKNEVDLVKFFTNNSHEKILEFDFEDFLSDVNDGRISITSAYLYEKLFFDKEKGINFIEKLGFQFESKDEIAKIDGDCTVQQQNISSPEENNSEDKNISVPDEIKDTEMDDDFDFLTDLEDSDDFKEMADIELTDVIVHHDHNEVYFDRLNTNNTEKDIDTVEQIILANQGLVQKIASHYEKIVENSILDIDDLISSGNCGLRTAIQKFDPTLGYKFSTYATTWIRQNILRDIANYKLTIRLPVHIHDTINSLNKAFKESGNDDFMEQVNYSMTALDMSEDTIMNFLRIDKQFNQGIASLHHLVGEDQSTPLESFVDASNRIYGDYIKTPDEELMRSSFLDEINVIFDDRLDEREKYILSMRIGLNNKEPMTLEEIGTELNVTRERVRQIEAKSFRKLKNQFTKLKFNEYLEEFSNV